MITAPTSTAFTAASPAPDRVQTLGTVWPDLAVLTALFILLNPHVYGGEFPMFLLYFPGSVLAGEWWRLASHPFVHLSGYHLLVDGAAFLILYHGLAEYFTRVRRLCIVGLCATGSLAGAILTLPSTAASGFGGLSGIDHGLMVLLSLSMLHAGSRDPWLRLGGWCVLLAVMGKVLYELLTGHMLFGGLHLGAVGIPVVACHAGGVLGAVIASRLVRSNVPRQRRHFHQDVQA